MSDLVIRDLKTIEEFRQVVALEKAIWGYVDPGDIVTVPVFIFTVKRGATLVGAFDAEQMVGFAYAVVGLKQGKPMHWSHMAGVLTPYRGGLGARLKLAQRTRAMAQGIELIEWTFDPLQTLNAHFNLAKLGGVVEEYAENFYGESTSALHKGTPTDRLVCSWRIAEPHVNRRLEQPPSLRVRAAEVGDAPVVNRTEGDGPWRTNASMDLSLTDRRVWIEIPMGFTEMQQQAPPFALQWRLQVREMFQAYLGRGYRAVDFVLDRDTGCGRYLLANEGPEA
jgi:predicted GNAT superfamily acetyltransferase